MSQWKLARLLGIVALAPAFSRMMLASSSEAKGAKRLDTGDGTWCSLESLHLPARKPRRSISLSIELQLASCLELAKWLEIAMQP